MTEIEPVETVVVVRHKPKELNFQGFYDYFRKEVNSSYYSQEIYYERDRIQREWDSIAELFREPYTTGIKKSHAWVRFLKGWNLDSEKSIQEGHNAIASDYLLSTGLTNRTFVEWLTSEDRYNLVWSNILECSPASAGSLVVIAQRLHSLIENDAWDTLLMRSSENVVDLCVVAAAHPHIPIREAALNNLLTQLPYLMSVKDIYAITEILPFLPEKAYGLYDDVYKTVSESWGQQEKNDWLDHCDRWFDKGFKKKVGHKRPKAKFLFG